MGTREVVISEEEVLLELEIVQTRFGNLGSVILSACFYYSRKGWATRNTRSPQGFMKLHTVLLISVYSPCLIPSNIYTIIVFENIYFSS